ncbi:hypothetical protein SAMN05421786_1098 [Chryseobacterium ureilyticum]|uniref:Uncharacterized protein n=1 Tax=Chryseobacterium ureilyticum TaxID=373668 RepID=A0A1N7QD63_9FLAO|nr:hypothetical protein SAMN05421786_1098 [Chryseobacterium ureilyticum]
MKTAEPIKARRFLPFLKRFSISVVIIFLITILQIYWAMGILADQTSSSCMSCSFLDDTVLMSFLMGIFLSAVFILFNSVQKFFIKFVVEFLLLINVWIFWNYSIFVDRESSWSTYDFKAEMYTTLSQSFFPVVILGCICILLLHFKEIKGKFTSFRK